jgi:hypothetical protein
MRLVGLDAAQRFESSLTVRYAELAAADATKKTTQRCSACANQDVQAPNLIRDCVSRVPAAIARIMSDSALWRSLMQLAHGGSTLATLACDIAILVVVSTTVRRHRPDAYRGLQLWAILSLAAMVVLSLAGFVTPILAVRGGMDSFFQSTTILTTFGIVVHVVLVVLFVRGITALAQPPKPVVIEGTPPYR